MKKVRVSEIYGEWYYEKDTDSEDKTSHWYYLEGKDYKGQKWAWNTGIYHEILDFIKASDKDKQIMIDCY